MIITKYHQFLGFINKYPWWNYWGPVCGIAIAIFISSSISHPPTSGIRIPEFDKFLHSIGYAVFGYFARRAFSQTKRDLFARYAGIFAIVFCVFYGISDEIHQSFVPPRETDPIDLLADTIGATVGQAIHYIKQTRNKKQMLTAKNAE
ncbi:MAG: VanZ family protein [bacterium]